MKPFLNMSAFEFDMWELIKEYRDIGFSDEYILKNCEIVINDMRDPEPEVKGEWDT